MNSKQRIVIGLVFVLVSLFAYVHAVHNEMLASQPKLSGPVAGIDLRSSGGFTYINYKLRGTTLEWYAGDAKGQQNGTTTRDMSAQIADILARYDLSSIQSDPPSQPDSDSVGLTLITASGSMTLNCVSDTNPCTKLANELSGLFRMAITHRNGLD